MDVIHLHSSLARRIIEKTLERTLSKKYDLPVTIELEELEYADNGTMALATVKAKIKAPSIKWRPLLAKLLKLEDSNG